MYRLLLLLIVGASLLFPSSALPTAVPSLTHDSHALTTGWVDHSPLQLDVLESQGESSAEDTQAATYPNTQHTACAPIPHDRFPIYIRSQRHGTAPIRGPPQL